jgi:SAM-dependent MidA family methyltransferase
MIPPALAAQLAGGRAVAFSAFVDLALYDPVDGFYATVGRAGRRADFLTSPEVGPLFGALLARWLDHAWLRLGRPDPFVVVEAGAGPGTLARSVRVAEPACAEALAYLLVERSASQRASHAEHLPGWVGELEGVELAEFTATPRSGGGAAFASSAAPPATVVGAVLANELLDNVAFDVVRRTSGGPERLTVAADGDDLELAVAAADEVVGAVLAGLGVPSGIWVPWQEPARRWLAESLGRLEKGCLLVVDYGAPTPELANRPEMGWLRTFRGHERGGHPLDGPGTQDITTDVAIDQLQIDHPASRVRTQAELLRGLGIDGLVAEGRRVWGDRAHAPDVAALRARSRVREAEALTDPEGLGAFVALEWDVALDG